MKTKHYIAVLTAGLLMIGSPLYAASKYFKWVDENGVTHYTTTPPPEGKNSEEVRTYNSASKDQEKAKQNLEQRRENDAAERARTKSELAEKEKEQAEPNAVREERCQKHRNNLNTLKTGPRVRSKDPETGELIALDDEARAKMIADTEKALANCEKK
ncbi:MAG: DUF4124 domain-containing protein [Alcanivoracaceae bacterium]|nr:DUF4124 domain-containing protein [Alcanivoracaceae bacterium]